MPAPETTLRRAPLAAADLLLRWPADEPLAALISGGNDGAHNAWSILARPSEAIVISGEESPENALLLLEDALARTPRNTAVPSLDGTPPFTGGWIVALGYDLGACFEPHARATPSSTRRASSTPRAILHWCEDAWCFDHATRTLHTVGSPPAVLPENTDESWQLSPLRGHESDAQYAKSVARAIEYIHAGDAFQANIARRFSATLRGNPRAFAHAAISANHAWFGASIDLPDGGALVSMSPELFLRVRADGSIITRPIKGTRSADVASHELIDSEKDAAELAMIVDLMRNDLGRVAEIGSVRVTESRVLETHRTVHHGVAEIRAQLREDACWLDLLRATFPPGSVTGAPKVRAMQIIDELEVTHRGFYCGAIGFVSRSGQAALSVAIRTAQVSSPDADDTRNLAYHTGCGVVADSIPTAEVAESHAKTLAITRLA